MPVGTSRFSKFFERNATSVPTTEQNELPEQAVSEPIHPSTDPVMHPFRSLIPPPESGMSFFFNFN